MSSTRIYHNFSKIPITSTIILIFWNYELYRIHQGIHPIWTPKLEAAGIVRSRGTLADRSEEPGVHNKSGAGGNVAGEGAIRWTNLNGVPIPTLGALVRPFGKD